MNVLTYVMTMLLLLTALTYARMETFRTTAGLEVGFINYMETQGRKPISLVADEWYDSISFPRAQNDPIPKDKNPKEVVKANSRLSFHLFLNAVDRNANQEAYKQTRDLAKQLMTILYADQEFFQKIKEERSNFLDEIIDEIEYAAQNLPDEIKISKATRLSKLQFRDKYLQYVFYLMLHGLPKLEPKPTDPSDSDASGESFIDKQDDPVIAEESQEDKAAGGYVSLLDYITVRSYIKLRVYLASKPLLMAIYNNQDIVAEVLAKRSELYGEIQGQYKTKPEATLEFQSEFQNQGKASNYSAILDYSVTNVNPKTYE